ncbi:MAG TPA: LuxR C-terminal-related transcriptional regulator [Ktedonobacterales bacterium]|nr:LuxR C-terminal-related transcriptional regulator [Ktedonobacterales bacterium]
METVLLATKLRIPPPLQQAVERTRLTDDLERRVPHHKLILISAPAGCGKTTLLATWARASRFPIVWLSLGEEDDDVEHFLRYLLAGWAELQPAVRQSPLGLLLGGMTPDIDAVLLAFINAADNAPTHLVFVLDDFHLIEDPAIHSALTFVLDRLPPTVHFVMASRAEPPLPLARYRVRQELLELRAEDLQFSLDETADFLNQLMRLDFTHDELVALQAQLEGWVAGLQLAALTRQRRLSVNDQLVVSGRHRFIADYLSENVLARLPEDTQRFLLQTSILDRLCESLCDAVTGRAGNQQMLESLERANLFLVPLDDNREWFRYHHLFADFLHSELKRRHPAELAMLHGRAAQWHLAHDLPDQAFRHAAEADNAALVIRVFERFVPAKLVGGEIRIVERWLASLPPAWRATYPIIGFAWACTLLYTGQFDTGARILDELERLALAQGEDSHRHLARVTALRCLVACYQNDLAPAEALAQQAIRDLPEDELDLRNGVYGSLGDTYRSRGRWDEAKACYLKTLDFTTAPTFHAQSVVTFGALADLDLRQGLLHGAAAYWRRALAVIGERQSWGNFPLPLIGWVYIRMGEILYEWNELGEASDHIAQGLERAELGGDVQGMIAGYLAAGRSKLTAGDVAAASEYLERARPLVQQAPFPDWTGRFGRLQLECWLAQNKLRLAVEWAGEMLRGDADEGPAEIEEAQLATARVLVARGDAPSLERALALLGRSLRAAKEEGRVGVQIEALALRALAHWRGGEQASAMTALERALRLAEPEGYVRLFADFGLPMARLLQEAHARDVRPEYVEKLLAAFNGARSIRTVAGSVLPEPLSGREQEVLRLLAAGLTNREIAEALVVSPETVKKHTGSIYGKLGVGNRTEAAARARELDLLD